MTTTIHRCMIVAAAQRDFAQWLCEKIAGPAGAGMFVIGLSANGLSPATHYISIGQIDASFSEVLSNPEVLHRACTLKGIEATMDQCAELLAGSDVSADPLLSAMARLGLQLLQEPN